MKTTLIALALMATGVNAAAADLSLQLHGPSWHAAPRAEFDSTGRQWDELNVGLGIRSTYSETWSVQAGFYRNSVDRTTVYAVVNYTPLQIGPVRMGVFGGLATGYPAGVPLGAGGMVQWGPVTLRIVPPIKKLTPLTLGVEVGIPF